MSNTLEAPRLRVAVSGQRLSVAGFHQDASGTAALTEGEGRRLLCDLAVVLVDMAPGYNVLSWIEWAVAKRRTEIADLDDLLGTDDPNDDPLA